MKSLSREDFLDRDPYGEDERERERAERDFRDDQRREDEMIYGKDC